MWRSGRTSATAKQPSGHTASAGNSPSSPQRVDPSHPPLATNQRRQLWARSTIWEGVCAGTVEMRITQQIRQHAGALHNFLITTDTSAASHRSPCFRERLPLLFPAPSQRMSSPESYPSQHPHPVAERVPGMQSSLPFSLPPDFPFPVGVRPLRSHSHGVPLAPHPTPPLSTAAAYAQDRAPSFLHPFFLGNPPSPKKELKHLSAKAHLGKRPISLCPLPHLTVSCFFLRGVGNGRGRVPACKV